MSIRYIGFVLDTDRVYYPQAYCIDVSITLSVILDIDKVYYPQAYTIVMSVAFYIWLYVYDVLHGTS
jgi:hypothetical protein